MHDDEPRDTVGAVTRTLERIVMLNVAADFERGLALLALSLACLIAEHASRKWPEKFQAFWATLDGSIFFFGADAHLRIVRLSGLALIIVSYAALVGAAILL